jgi:hypothetical protein
MTVEALSLYQRATPVPVTTLSVAALPEHTASPVAEVIVGSALMLAVTGVLAALSQPVAAL